MNKIFLLTFRQSYQIISLNQFQKVSDIVAGNKVITKPLKFKNLFGMLLIQRNKLKCSEGWKNTSMQLQQRSSRDLLRIPRCQGWAEHWSRMSGCRLRLSTQQADRLWAPRGKAQRLLPDLTRRATEVLLPMQNQGSTAAIPSALPVSPD